MLKAVGVIALAVIIFKLDYPSVKKQSESKKDQGLYIMFFIIALSITLLHIFEVSLPNPTEGIKQIYQPFAEPLRSLLERYFVD